jgi:hypothetical protein
MIGQWINEDRVGGVIDEIDGEMGGRESSHIEHSQQEHNSTNTNTNYHHNNERYQRRGRIIFAGL